MAFPFVPKPSWPEFVADLESRGVVVVRSNFGVRHLLRLVNGTPFRAAWPHIMPGDEVQPSTLQATVTALGFSPEDDFNFMWLAEDPDA